MVLTPVWLCFSSMVTQEISLHEIDAQDDTFRISEDLDPPAIRDSLREIGQLNPVVLLEKGERKIVVCGFRRVRALRKLGTPGILARMLPKDCDPVRSFKIALWDNLAHRQLNPLEKARVLANLRNQFGVPEASILSDYLPILDLSPAESVLQSFLLLHRIDPALRRCFAEGRLTHASLDALAAKPQALQDRVAILMGKIRLSASLQRKFLELIEDLESAGGIPSAEVLNAPEIHEMADDIRLSPFQRGEKVYEALYRRRNPRLSKASDHFLLQLKRIQFPDPIRIRAHPFFEEPGLHVEFDANDPEQFRDLIAALQRAAAASEFEGLFVAK